MLAKRTPDITGAQAAAYRVTKRFGFLHPAEMPLEDVAMDRGVIVVPGVLEGSEARLVRKGERGIIRVKAGVQQSGRWRFSVTHELGHWEQHKGTQWFVCSAKDLRDYEKSPEEAEANTFAAELLMPTFLLRDRCGKAFPSLSLVKSIADEFHVSLTSAAIRMTHLTNQESVLVLSASRCVDWWITKSRRFGVWMQVGQRLSEESLAFHAFNGEQVDDEVAEHPADVWFPHRHEGTDFTVSEQSMKLGGYDAVLSILTIGDGGLA